MDTSRWGTRSWVHVGLTIAAVVAAILAISSAAGECRSDADQARFLVAILLWLLVVVGLIASHTRRPQQDNTRRGLWTATILSVLVILGVGADAVDGGVEVTQSLFDVPVEGSGVSAPYLPEYLLDYMGESDAQCVVDRVGVDPDDNYSTVLRSEIAAAARSCGIGRASSSYCVWPD